MKISQAIAQFADTPLAGWDGASWTEGVAFGDFFSFDQFISDRPSGQKKRMFVTTDGNKIPSGYDAVRVPNGDVYLVTTSNPDFVNTELYKHTFLLQRAAFSADVISKTITERASGLAGDMAEASLGTYFCDIERVTSDRSTEFDSVRYPVYNIFLPRAAAVTADVEIEIDAIRYDVREVNLSLDLKIAMAARRGTPA